MCVDLHTLQFNLGFIIVKLDSDLFIVDQVFPDVNTCVTVHDAIVLLSLAAICIACH